MHNAHPLAVEVVDAALERVAEYFVRAVERWVLRVRERCEPSVRVRTSTVRVELARERHVASADRVRAGVPSHAEQRVVVALKLAPERVRLLSARAAARVIAACVAHNELLTRLMGLWLPANLNGVMVVCVI